MSLTDNEKRDAVLLIEDKREVELVWDGKTSEVCNVVLPFQVIEQVDEPQRMTKLSHQERPLAGTKKRSTQMSAWAV